MPNPRSTPLLKPRPEDALPVRILRAANVCVARIYHQVTVRSACQLPRRGAAILVCNHTSGLDPLLIQSASPRLITWMMASEYYDIKPLRWVFRTVGVIPTTRSGRDTAATRAALRALADGRILGIFPEGRIASEPAQLLPFQTGVAMLAIKTGVPVYPVWLDGTQRGKQMLEAFLHPNHATLAFGPPVAFDRSSTQRDVLEPATQAIRSAIASLGTKVQ